MLAATAVALALSPPALAADPESGEVSAAKPTTSWTGGVVEPSGGYELAVIANGSTNGTCEQPHCDTYTLKVPAGASALAIKASGGDDDTFSIMFELEDPSGETTLVADDGESLPEREHTVEAPAAGTWTIRVFGTPNLDSFDYEGTATLTVPGAAGTTPPPSTGDTPPPAPPSQGGGGGSTPPSSQPAPAPAPVPASGSAPSTAPAAKVTIGAPSRKARSSRRLGKGKRLTVNLTSTAPLTRITGIVASTRARTRVLGTGRVTKVGAGRGRVGLRLAKRLKPGRYVIVVSGFDAQGRRVIAERTISVTR